MAEEPKQVGGDRSRPPRGTGRDALIRAIIRVVAREGVDALTYRAVAEEAGVAHGLVYYHFRSRDAMISRALSWAAQDALESSRVLGAEDALDRFASDVGAMIEGDPEPTAFQFELALQGLRRPELGEEVRRLYRHYIDVFGRALNALDVPADETLATLVFAAVDGLSLQQLIFDDRRRTDQAMRRLQDLLGCLAGAEHEARAS